jgi:phage-related protein
LHRYGFEFNGETAQSHHIYVENRPNIPTGKEKIEYIKIAGKDTPVALRTGNYENVEIYVDCGWKVDKKLWNEKIREVRRWLRGAGSLTFSDSTETFWKVNEVIIKEFVRTIKKYGKFRVKFICDPHEYIKGGLQEMKMQDAVYNPYDLCHPTYLITGNGNCTLTVNGRTMKATVGQNLTVDTERMIAYRRDGVIMNTAVTGDYEDLYLQPGENDIKITSGFTLKVIPNWRRL